MKQMCPIVSVIVPIYKVENYLQKCIDSICKQTYKQLEIILVDDGSPDSCGKICDDSAEKDARIIVIHKENGGLSSARNAGLNIAKGEYISFVDADDTIHPQFIEILIALCIQYDCDIAQCDFLAVTENSLKLPLNSQQSIKLYNNRQAIHELCRAGESVKYNVAWNKVYKQELFKDVRYPLGRIHEDEFTTYLLLWKAKRIAVTNQYMYYYLQRATSLMGTSFSIERLDLLDALKKRLLFLENNNFEQEYLKTLRMFVYLIKKDYELLTKNVKNCEEICARLLAEKEEAEKKIEDMTLLIDQISRKCTYSKKSRIILYGAGHWGRIYYEWIKKNHYGKVVGWVDNAWYALKEMDQNILPIDSLMSIQYDYVLITIENKLVQEEVAQNLLDWGIPRNKIILL